MKIEDTTPSIYEGYPQVLDYNEAERYVEKLKKFSLIEVGNSEYLQQHYMIEKLNIQAHQSAASNSEEYVLEALLTFNKIEVLIHNLILIETWKEFVYPVLLTDLAGRNNMRLYFILYHEATIVNLLEVILYHKHVVSEMGEKLIELIDYIARKLIRLNSGYDTFRSAQLTNSITPTSSSTSNTTSTTEGLSAAAREMMVALETRTPADEIALYYHNIEFRTCISSVSIARFLTEHIDSMPLNAISRITDTHDYLMLIIPLIENPPWTRRTTVGKWEKMVDYNWVEVQPINLLKLTKIEGQPWLSLYHLISKKVCSERYVFTSYRKGQLLRVRKYMNELLLDQLPVLADIQRFMDELFMREAADQPTHLSSTSNNSAFVLEQVAALREGLIRGADWAEIARVQLSSVFTMTDASDADVRRMAQLYGDDGAGERLVEEGGN